MINKNKVKHTAHYLGKFNTAPLLAHLSQVPDDHWETSKSQTPNYNKKTLFLQKATHITLKFTDLRGQSAQIHYHRDWEIWQKVVLPVLEQVAQVYGYEQYFFPIIMVAKLPPKCPIIAHTDGTEFSHAPHKVHIPLCTNDETFFFIEGQRFHMEKGFAYEVDNIARHWVINNGDTERVHLIFELMFGEEIGEILTV